MESGFLSLKESGGGKGVKEKSGGSIDVLAKLNTRVDEGTTNSSNVVTNTHGLANDTTQVIGVTPSTADGPVVSRSGDHMVDENVGQTPSNSTDNPNKGASYANLFTGESSISERFANMAYGFFLGKHAAYPVIANYFNSMEGLDAMLENGLWFICNNPLILKKWNPDVNLLKEDVGNVPVWVKLHGVPVTAFNEDGLSAIATKISTPLMLDSYTSDICTCCKVFGHVQDECPNNKVSDVVKSMKKPSQTHRGVLVGPKVGCQPTKQVCRQVSKKNNVSTSGNKKKDAEPTKEVSKSNSFDVLNLVENDVDLCTNGGTSNLTYKKANSSGSSFWNVKSSSTSTTPIDRMERLIINGTATIVDDKGKTLTRVDSSGGHDSDDKIASVDNDMANFLASKDIGYGINSLLKQWKESYENG
ncbi:reverse transcriptase domain-containing protein [Tanacetum coccineum]